MLKIVVFILFCGSVFTDEVNTENWQQVCGTIKSDLKCIGGSGANNQALANDSQTNTQIFCEQEQQFYNEKVAYENQLNLVAALALYTSSCLPIGYCMFEVDQLATYKKNQVPNLPTDDQALVTAQLDSIRANIRQTLNNSDLTGKLVAQLLAPLSGYFINEATNFQYYLQSIKN